MAHTAVAQQLEKWPVKYYVKE